MLFTEYLSEEDSKEATQIPAKQIPHKSNFLSGHELQTDNPQLVE
jgi:hypothetical protein